ncbi:hypothetical protein AB0L82_36060 [Nocardia sp. NPDC052001]|uniref:hypothetical protein n=1 Tax=Nocardia sp. NPDC052001 TaxID=3154853 RepID=UPI00342788A3
MSTRKDFGPIQASRELGLAQWQWYAARRSELIGAPDRGGRWSAELIAEAGARIEQIRAQLPDGPPIGAVRAAERIAQHLDGVAVAGCDVEALALHGLLTGVDEYKGHALYDQNDLDRVAADHGELIAGLATDRLAWQQASLTRDEACEQLGWNRTEFARVTSELGIEAGRFGRWPREQVQALATDEQLCERVRRARLLGPDQAAEFLRVRRREVDYLVASGFLAPATHVDSEISRNRYVSVALYTTGALEDLLDFAVIDWEQLRGLEPGDPSPLREFTALPIERAKLVRALATDLTQTHGVEVDPRYDYRADTWHLHWQPDIKGVPSREGVAAEIAARPLLRPHRRQIALHPAETTVEKGSSR